jgi:hypothetical protein
MGTWARVAVSLSVGCCVLLGAPGSAVGSGGVQDGAPQSAQRAVEGLFVQTARRGTLRRVAGRRGVFRLMLAGAHRHVSVIGGRPQRRAGAEPLSAFVRRWRARGFASDPPNAALVVAGARASRDVVIVELSRPRRGPRSVSYIARVVRGASTPALARFAARADARVAARFGQASLFIDSAASVSYPTVQMTVSVPRTPPDEASRLAFVLGTSAGDSAVFASDYVGFPLRVISPGPVSFEIEDQSAFAIWSSSGSSADITLKVTPQRDPIVGMVLGAVEFADQVTIQGAGQNFAVTNGRFSIPVSALAPGRR